MQVLELYAGRAQFFQQRGDAGAIVLGVIGIDQFAAVAAERKLVGGKRGRNALQFVLQLQRQLLLAELAHQLRFFLDEDEPALADYADAVGHFLGFVDVMRGQDDGDAGLPQRAHQRPHVAPQLDVDAGRRLVEKQDARLVRQRLGDQHAALHAARQRPDHVVFLLPQRQLLQHFLDVGGLGSEAEQAAAERDRRPHRFEGVGRQFLRHEPDEGARGAPIADDVVAVDFDGPGARLDYPADRADERRFARAIGAQQRENLAAADFEVDVLQRLEAGGVDLAETSDGDDC